MIPNQWDCTPLRRNQTHSLSRRLELLAIALTFLWVPTHPNAKPREPSRHAHGTTHDFFCFMRVARWLIYEEDRPGCGHKQVCPLREAHEKTQRCPSSPRHREGLLPTSAVTPPVNHSKGIPLFLYTLESSLQTASLALITALPIIRQ